MDSYQLSFDWNDTGPKGAIGSDFSPEYPAGLNGPSGPIPPQRYEDTEDTFDPPKDDKIFKPSHYAQWKIEPITYIMRNDMEFWRGNIIKYASRAGYKTYDGMDVAQSEITDLEKVRRYAEMRINQLKGDIEL